MSIHEESTIAALGPMMGVFNNLVMFDQHVPQNSLNSIVPDLASNWSWSEDGKELRQRHDVLVAHDEQRPQHLVPRSHEREDGDDR